MKKIYLTNEITAWHPDRGVVVIGWPGAETGYWGDTLNQLETDVAEAELTSRWAGLTHMQLQAIDRDGNIVSAIIPLSAARELGAMCRQAMLGR